MEGMFYIARAVNQDSPAGNVASVKTLKNSPRLASPHNQPLVARNVANATSLHAMFKEAQAYNQPLAAWDVTRETDMSHGFHKTAASNQVLCWDLSGKTTSPMLDSARLSYANATSSCPRTTPEPTQLPTPRAHERHRHQTQRRRPPHRTLPTALDAAAESGRMQARRRK